MHIDDESRKSNVENMLVLAADMYQDPEAIFIMALFLFGDDIKRSIIYFRRTNGKSFRSMEIFSIF